MCECACIIVSAKVWEKELEHTQEWSGHSDEASQSLGWNVWRPEAL